MPSVRLEICGADRLPSEGVGKPGLGWWKPLSVAATSEAFGAAPFLWWFSGGHALELHLGRSWRDHDDSDVGIRRRDVDLLGPLLADWDIWIAAAGRLSRWTGEELSATRHQNNLWCRHRDGGAWLLDVQLGDGDEQEWCYRRDGRVRFPWAEAVLRTTAGTPYLAPELQLLFKSTYRRDKDELDAREVLPELDLDRRERMAGLLPSSHPWQLLLKDEPAIPLARPRRMPSRGDDC